jgi:hypothetical protein
MRKQYNSGNITTKVLLKRQFDRDDKDHDTSLHYAVRKGHLDMVKLLVGFGCDKEIRNRHDETPLITAVVYNYPDIARYLISIGCNINAVDSVKRSCLYFATYCNTADMLALLLEFNAKVDIPGGQLPLHNTIRSYHYGGNKDMDQFQLLLLHGSNINLRDKSGYIFTDLVFKHSDHKIFERMIDLCSFLPVIQQNIHILIRNSVMKYYNRDYSQYTDEFTRKIMAFCFWDEELTKVLQKSIPKITEDQVIDIRYQFYFNRSLVSRLLIYSEWKENMRTRSFSNSIGKTSHSNNMLLQ